MKKMMKVAVITSVAVIGFLYGGLATSTTPLEDTQKGAQKVGTSIKEEATKVAKAPQKAIEEAHQKAVDLAHREKDRIEVGTKQVVQRVEEKAKSWHAKIKETVTHYWNKLTGKKS